MPGFLEMLRNRRRRGEIYSQPAFWNGKAASLEGEAVSMWRNNHLNKLYEAEQLAVMEAALPDIAGTDMLDLGCGTGRISRHLAARGARVVGVDFAEKAVAIARKSGGTGDLRYEVGSMFDLAGEALYDSIVSWGSVAIACRTAGELRGLLSGLHRLMRPGGRLHLQEPVHRGFLHRVLDLDVAEFRGMLSEAGFTDVRVTEMHFWPARLALAYIEWPRAITAPIYRAGQAIMHSLGSTGSGDYKAISARRP